MTVSEKTTAARNNYVGNGVKTVFNFTFETLAISNSLISKNYALKVILEESDVETEQVEDTDYTVQYNTDTRLGTITFTTAPTSAQTITILSEIPRSQDTDYISIGTDKFPAASHEGALDKLTLITSELDENINRSILLPESSNLTNVTIPVSTASANKVIVVNSTGDDLTTASLIDIDTYPITAFAETLLDDTTALEARGTLEAQEDVITTRGDIVRGSSAGDAERLALGTNEQILKSDGTDLIWGSYQDGTTSTKGISYSPDQITISNGTDTDHDIDFTAGNFTFSGGDGQAVASALTKQIDATWAAGDAAGGLASGVSLSNDTWYYCFALSNAAGTSTDFGFDTSLTAANLLADSAVVTAGLTKYKRIASLLTDGSSNILNGKWNGAYFTYSLPVVDSTTAITTSQVEETMSVPPVDCIATIGVYLNETTNNLFGFYVIQPKWKGSIGSPSATNNTISHGSDADTISRPLRVNVEIQSLLTDSNVYTKGNNTATDTTLSTVGYIDLTLL